MYACLLYILGIQSKTEKTSVIVKHWVMYTLPAVKLRYSKSIPFHIVASHHFEKSPLLRVPTTPHGMLFYRDVFFMDRLRQGETSWTATAYGRRKGVLKSNDWKHRCPLLPNAMIAGFARAYTALPAGLNPAIEPGPSPWCGCVDSRTRLRVGHNAVISGLGLLLQCCQSGRSLIS